ncbi:MULTISPECIES: Lrp/AsnC family transcriptional regulator [Exiguobacterium]|jgi:DNA-binding Lrp family transcriptional regulator|uniref:Lrp/AsnC family transcriptional regulator n=1 Tax=Exiguobacterium TaxID=33986 RepID=UPI00044DB9CB|nr:MULTISPECIES: Lrp/AsnC family transcriptional regulator [Exiguobacterium]EZP60413.1 AsnC family transcriptional regulator [Exiguobacterium sp. RIT341]KOP30038.1 AsnC family transcriptional regulator [Exiguobacterium sp. BMC-KP]KQS40505.1 AsnC family transcriptional regulator [Exiguobacterium sp. Leaf196]MBF8152138.1 Lrp/AsnC family transcriptional regulator [Exiguobacterium sp. TBG-PICH-001]MDQ6467554.1 Lrp/AsnC family transcriptional regulator [Exiguobacterium acetylicum]
MYTEKQLELLALLTQNGPMDVNLLAQMLDWEASEVAASIETFKRDGVLLGYTAVIDWQKIHAHHGVTAFIDVKVTPKRGRGFDEVAERIHRFPEVTSLYLMSGAYDLQVVLDGKSLQEVSQFVSEKLSTLDSVISTTTHFRLKTYKHDGVLFSQDDDDKRLKVSP